MTTSVQDHLRRFPNARPSTLVLIEKKNAKTEQLKKENEAMAEILRGQLERTPRAWWDRLPRWPSWVWR